MAHQSRLSISEILGSLRESRRELARVRAELDAAVVTTRDTLALSVELLAKASDALRG